MPVKLVAYLSYADAPAGIGWLTALGFAVLSREDSDTGAVTHAELRLGDAVVMVASDDRGYQVPPLLDQSTGMGVYLVVDDVDTIYSAALDAGGVTVIAPEDTSWGSRRARVLDPEGREWSFGTYEPGQTW